MVKSSSTIDILATDLDLYQKWIGWQFISEMNWVIIELDHIKTISMFDVPNEEELKEVFKWKNTQQLLK